MFGKIKIAFTDPYIRNRILAVLIGLIIFRLLSNVPIPTIDSGRIANFLANDQFQLLGLLNLFSGGGLASLSIAMLGVGPYITGSIIMQLMTAISPRVKAMYHDEGQIGRERFNQISRYITIPVALIQGFSLLLLLRQADMIPTLETSELILTLAIIVAGAMLVTWVGELMTEFGVGSGVSILIFAGIIAGLPTVIRQQIFLYDPSQLMTFIGLFVVLVIIIAGVVTLTQGERPIPVTYAKQVRGGTTYGNVSTYVPLRMNMAGVMPIIFALSMLLFPQFLAGFFVNSVNPTLINIGIFLQQIQNNSAWYAIIYFVLVFAFTYFYTAITVDPDSMAENLQKNGAFIHGIRPGDSTSEYIGTVLSRITLVGALFLGTIAVIPIIIQQITGNAAFAIGGTGLLIIVAVIIDFINRLNAQVSMREY